MSTLAKLLKRQGFTPPFETGEGGFDGTVGIYDSLGMCVIAAVGDSEADEGTFERADKFAEALVKELNA